MRIFDTCIADCPPGYIGYGEYCYTVLEPQETWDDGETSCADNETGAHLAWITDSAENTFITNLLAEWANSMV